MSEWSEDQLVFLFLASRRLDPEFLSELRQLIQYHFGTIIFPGVLACTFWPLRLASTAGINFQQSSEERGQFEQTTFSGERTRDVFRGLISCRQDARALQRSLNVVLNGFSFRSCGKITPVAVGHVAESLGDFSIIWRIAGQSARRVTR